MNERRRSLQKSAQNPNGMGNTMSINMLTSIAASRQVNFNRSHLTAKRTTTPTRCQSSLIYRDPGHHQRKYMWDHILRHQEAIVPLSARSVPRNGQATTG